MKTLALTSPKGGTGKSTIAINLAVLAHQKGLETLLVDLDTISATTSDWSSIRKESQPLVVSAAASDVETLCDQAKEEGFDLVILDFPPYFTDDILTAVVFADEILIPITPNFPELQSLSRYINAIEQDYYSVLLNKCSDKPVAEETITMLQEHNVPVSPISLGYFDELLGALSDGLGISEFKPDSNAAKLIEQLLDSICTLN